MSLEWRDSREDVKKFREVVVKGTSIGRGLFILGFFSKCGYANWRFSGCLNGAAAHNQHDPADGKRPELRRRRKAHDSHSCTIRHRAPSGLKGWSLRFAKAVEGSRARRIHCQHETITHGFDAVAER
jgi:hypothetical protein